MNTNPTPDALAELIANMRTAAKHGYGAAADWSAEECANYWSVVAFRCRKALRDAADSLEAFHAKPVVGEELDKIERAIRLADTLTQDVPVSAAALGHVKAGYEALAALRALQSPPPVVSGEASAKMQHVAYFDEGEFHWMSGIKPRDCELYASFVSTPPVVEEGRREALREIINRRVCGFVGEYEIDREELIDAILATPATAQGDVREALERLADCVFASGLTKENTNQWFAARRALATLKGQDNV